MKAVVRFAVTALFLLVLGAEGRGQAGVDGLEAQRERWNSMSAAEREAVRTRFEEFRRLSDEEREAIQERAGELRTRLEGLRHRVPPHLREAFEGEGPHRQRELLMAELKSEVRESGRALREALPADLESMLLEAPPHERPMLLHRWRGSHRGPDLKRALRKVFRKLGVDESELEEIADQRREERTASLGRLLRQRLVETITEGGVPEGFTDSEWSELEPLEDRAFLDAVAPKLVGTLCHRGPGPHFGPSFGRPGMPGRDALAPEDRERFRLLHRLGSELDPRWGPLNDRGPEERRARCLELLEAGDLLAPSEIADLRTAEGEVFVEELRRRLRDKRMEFGGGPGGPGAGHRDGRGRGGPGPDGGGFGSKTPRRMPPDR